MGKINLAITGCMGRMGQQLIKSTNRDKSIKLVSLTENRVVNKKFGGIKPELNTERAFRLIKRDEEIARANKKWWSHLKQLKN